MKLQGIKRLSKQQKLAVILTTCFQTFFLNNALAQDAKAEPNSFFHKNTNSQVLTLNQYDLQAALLNVNSRIVLALPLPNGETVNFELTPESIMSAGLASKYPNIRTFSGVSLIDPNSTGRFDITPNGFHGMFYHQGERVFVEPMRVVLSEQSATSNKAKNTESIIALNEENQTYKSYLKADSRLNQKNTHKFYQPNKITNTGLDDADLNWQKTKLLPKTSNPDSTMKTYRIAIAAAAEYTAYHGGRSRAMAEIITLVNRLNQIYQHDLAIKLVLVENNNLLVFTDVNTDPFDNTSDDGDKNTGVINDIIGNDNYDIGHVLNTDGGGLASLGAACNNFIKGDGVTGDSVPTNDAFYIDYVAHEIGHQFGANHSFNGTAGACLDNREPTSAYEVGSGSTIMSYAGICDDQNLQSNSDAFFHAISIDEITTHLKNIGDCGVVSGPVNKAAVVNAGLDYTIPSRTPFKLMGSAEVTANKSLTYSWQQFDLGAPSASFAEQVDDGSRPLFRAFLPRNEASRNFPKLSNVLSRTRTIGETLPTTNRELNFRLMAFDNQGGVSFDEATLTVVDSGEAFILNNPRVGDTWQTENNNISWQVADTDIAPIQCKTVDVLLSKDNGQTFDVTLAQNITNNGSYNVSMANFCAEEINTSLARLKLVCTNNIFYTINPGPFNINKTLSSEDIRIVSQQPLTIIQGESLELNSGQFTYLCGESAEGIIIADGANYSVTGATITPNSEFSGELTVPVVVKKNNIGNRVFLVKIMVEAKPNVVPTPPDTVPETPAVTPAPSESSSGSMFWLLLCLCAVRWRDILYQPNRKNSH